MRCRQSLAVALDLSGVKIVGIAVLSLELGACSPRILKPSGQVCMVFVIPAFAGLG